VLVSGTDGGGAGQRPLCLLGGRSRDRSRYTSPVPAAPGRNIYFELTEAFNRVAPTVVLASGQAVVYHRLAIMSKDGDWIIRETQEACDRVFGELEARGARYRPAAPLDVRWLAGGWSSHFEFFDARQRRIRCDFCSRPPRVAAAVVNALFDAPPTLHVVDVPVLIALKQTQRAKDYPIIGELATRLAPRDEIAVTTPGGARTFELVKLVTIHGE